MMQEPQWYTQYRMELEREHAEGLIDYDEYELQVFELERALDAYCDECESKTIYL